MPGGRGLVVVGALLVVGLALYVLTLEPSRRESPPSRVEAPRAPVPAPPMDRHDEEDREALRDLLRDGGRR